MQASFQGQIAENSSAGGGAGASSKPYRFISVVDFAEAFKASKQGTLRQQEVDMPFDRNLCPSGALVRRPILARTVVW